MSIQPSVRAVYILRPYSGHPGRPSVKELHMADDPPSQLRGRVGRRVDHPGMADRGAGRAAVRDAAGDLPSEPLLLEIGSHQGRSTVVLAPLRVRAGRPGRRRRPVRRRPALRRRARPATKFEQNLARAGLTDTVELLPEYSTRARPTWTRDIDYLYIDGKHDYWTLTRRPASGPSTCPPGAPILVHDCYSSIGVTLGVLATCCPRARCATSAGPGRWPCSGSARRPRPTGVRILREVPWWLRNVAIKVLLRLRLRPVAARAVRARSPYDPY